MKRMAPIVVGMLWIGLLVTGFAWAGEPRFVAFSVGEAARRAQLGQITRELETLGGITRIGAYVFDPQSRDLILIGLAEPSLPPAQWDDLVVALRTRIRDGVFPEVSIDPSQNATKDGQQDVNFSGHLEDTPFGNDLLICDIFLKHYSLGLTEMPGHPPVRPIAEVPSYVRLIEEEVRSSAAAEGVTISSFEWLNGKRDGGAQGQPSRDFRYYDARFWYQIGRPYEAFARPGRHRPEVFRIDRVELIIASQRVRGDETESSRKCREGFARFCTEHLEELARRFPPIKKLKVLFDLTAVADGVFQLTQAGVNMPYLKYLTHEYEVRKVPTPRQYPLKEMTAVIRRTDRATELIYVYGGVQIRPSMAIVEDLNGGSMFGFREFVLEQRPSAHALKWELPLQGWRMPNGVDILGEPDSRQAAPRLPEPEPAGSESGCVVSSAWVRLPATGAAAPAGEKVRPFAGFLPPKEPILPLHGRLPTYKWNGVYIDPNPVKSDRPLPAGLRQKTVEAFKTGEGPVRRVKLGIPKENP